MSDLHRTAQEVPTTCGFEGCERFRRYRDWCSTHYGQWKRTGIVWPIREWAEPSPCLVCGQPPIYAYRQFCSAACRAIWADCDGSVPSSVDCVACGITIDLSVRGKGGYRKHRNTLLCRRCRQDKRKHGISVEQLANRDGTQCGICEELVDMGLRSPDQRRASVDHINPRALGGSNDPANLQLAHLDCNRLKGARVDV